MKAWERKEKGQKNSFKKKQSNKYNKPSKDIKYTESLDPVCYCPVFKFFGCYETPIMKTDRFNQPIYFENTFTSQFMSKDMLLWERDYSFIST